MLPTPAEVEIARRVLKTIADNRNPSQADALTLRLWAGPRTNMLPLEEIATEIIEEGNPKTYAPLGDSTQTLEHHWKVAMRQRTVHGTYRLVHPVVAFQQDTRKVVTVPVGAVVELMGIKSGPGIQRARWDGHPITVYEQDLADSGLQLVPQSVSSHPT